MGNKGQESGLGSWQFVCKQVTSWHSSADSRVLGKYFQRIESLSSGDSWGGEGYFKSQPGRLPHKEGML